jgi:hypothetical protein
LAKARAHIDRELAVTQIVEVVGWVWAIARLPAQTKSIYLAVDGLL